jgi:hypothetical protein
VVDVSLPSPLPPTFPPQVVRAFLREPEFSVGMQKFALICLAASTALLGFLAPVEGVALVDRETNAERFARGLPPLPPRAPNQREGMPPVFSFADKPGY